MLDPTIGLFDQLKNGFLAVWSWLPKAGLFGIGFLLGSAFFKPIMDLLTANANWRTAKIASKKAKQESSHHEKEIQDLHKALEESESQRKLIQARLKQLGIRRYLLGSVLGLIIAAFTILGAYLNVPKPQPPKPPSPKFAEGFSTGFSEGFKQGAKAKSVNASGRKSAPPPTKSIVPPGAEVKPDSPTNNPATN